MYTSRGQEHRKLGTLSGPPCLPWARRRVPSLHTPRASQPPTTNQNLASLPSPTSDKLHGVLPLAPASLAPRLAFTTPRSHTQLFLILASRKGQSHLQCLAVLEGKGLCPVSAPVLERGVQREPTAGPLLETPPDTHTQELRTLSPLLEGECLGKVRRWGHFVFSKTQHV